MERWWGFRPCTPDEGPLLGRGPLSGLWLACGHHRNGVLMAAATAEAIADCVSQGHARADLERLLPCFQWQRFDAGVS
jgi:glycine oxidase